MLPAPDVLIVSYRRADLLASCLSSVRRHLPESVIRVWDNHSDGSEEICELARLHRDVDWHFSAENLGFAAAVNRLMARVGGSTALLLNPDATLLCDLEATRSALLEPKVAAAAPWLCEPGHRPWDNAHREPTFIRELVSYAGWEDRLGRASLVSQMYRTPPEDVDGYLSGACLLIGTAAWAAVGPFDERYFLYGEESDWCHRARALGWRIVSVQEGGVAHSAGGTVADFDAAASWSRQLLDENRRRYLSDHHGRLAGMAFVGVTSLINTVQPSKVRAMQASAPDFVITSPTLDFGGAERQRVQLANALVAQGFRVTMRVLQHVGGMDVELDPRVNLVVRGYHHVRRDAGPHTLLVTGTTRIETAYGIAWRNLNRPHGRWVAANHVPARPDGPTFARDVNIILRHCDGIVHLADIHRDEHQSQFDLDRDRYWIIPNGVPVRPVAPEARHPDGTTRFVVASRLEEPKQIHLLVRAFAEGLDDLDWTLDIWGDGGYRDAVAAAIPQRLASRIRMRGWCHDVAGVLAESDVYCLPSRAEAQPMVILEALEAGVCVAAAPVSSVPEVLAGGAGIIIDPPTIQNWRNTIRLLVANPQLRDRTAAAGRTRVEAYYSVDAMAERYLRLREEVLPQRRSKDS